MYFYILIKDNAKHEQKQWNPIEFQFIYSILGEYIELNRIWRGFAKASLVFAKSVKMCWMNPIFLLSLGSYKMRKNSQRNRICEADKKFSNLGFLQKINEPQTISFQILGQYYSPQVCMLDSLIFPTFDFVIFP